MFSRILPPCANKTISIDVAVLTQLAIITRSDPEECADNSSYLNPQNKPIPDIITIPFLAYPTKSSKYSLEQVVAGKVLKKPGARTASLVRRNYGGRNMSSKFKRHIDRIPNGDLG